MMQGAVAREEVELSFKRYILEKTEAFAHEPMEDLYRVNLLGQMLDRYDELQKKGLSADAALQRTLADYADIPAQMRREGFEEAGTRRTEARWPQLTEEEAADTETASQVVATLSSKLVEVNDSYVSRSVMVFGSSVIFTDSFMNTTAFSDADYVRDLLLYITGTDASSVTTSTERVQTNVLDVTASRGTINILGIVFIAGIPVVILAAGLIIFLKRRHL